MDDASPQHRAHAFEMMFDTVPETADTVFSSARSFDSEQDSWEPEKEEGKLAVDILETNDDIIVLSTMAGALPDKIEVHIHNDLLTIRGERHKPMSKHQAEGAQMIHQECYWGRFSRTIVLPTEVKGEKAKAEYRRGVLSISIPKHSSDARISVRVVEE